MFHAFLVTRLTHYYEMIQSADYKVAVHTNQTCYGFCLHNSLFENTLSDIKKRRRSCNQDSFQSSQINSQYSFLMCAMAPTSFYFRLFVAIAIAVLFSWLTVDEYYFILNFCKF